MAYEKFHCFNSFKHFTSLHTFDSHCDLLTHNVDFTSSLVDPHTGVYSIFIRRCSWNRKKLLEWLSYCSDSCLSFKSLYCRNGLACGCASIYIICEFNYNYSCSFIHFLFVYSNGLIVLVCKI